jgi:hypothetical protein
VGISRPKDCYKPVFIRTPAILVLLLLVLGLAGLVEYACRTLPTQGFRHSSMMPNITGLRVRDVPPASAAATPQSSVSVPASVEPATTTQIHESFLDPSVSSLASDPPPVSAPPSSIPAIASSPPVPITSTAIHGSFLDPGVNSAGNVASLLSTPR